MPQEPWQLTRSAFCREFVFHITRSAVLPALKQEGMIRGSFMMGYVPDLPGDTLVIARRSDVEALDAEEEDCGKGEALRPKTRIDYIKGVISWDKLIAMPMTKTPHQEILKAALAMGKPVPKEVLKDYPDLHL